MSASKLRLFLTYAHLLYIASCLPPQGVRRNPNKLQLRLVSPIDDGLPRLTKWVSQSLSFDLSIPLKMILRLTHDTINFTHEDASRADTLEQLPRIATDDEGGDIASALRVNHADTAGKHTLSA